MCQLKDRIFLLAITDIIYRKIVGSSVDSSGGKVLHVNIGILQACVRFLYITQVLLLDYQ